VRCALDRDKFSLVRERDAGEVIASVSRVMRWADRDNVRRELEGVVREG